MDYTRWKPCSAWWSGAPGAKPVSVSVQIIEGEAVWQAGRDGRWSMELLESALSRSDSPKGLPDEDGRYP